MKTKSKKTSISFLRLANYFLLALNWTQALYAYPRLPEEIPVWISLFGQNILKSKKSLSFFIIPAVQTLFILAFLFLIKFKKFKRPQPKNTSTALKGEIKDRFVDLKEEYILLFLIFVNLIFIHLQTSLILLSHQLGTGINKLYLFSLFAVLLILFPYYRVKKKFLLKKEAKSYLRIE